MTENLTRRQAVVTAAAGAITTILRPRNAAAASPAGDDAQLFALLAERDRLMDQVDRNKMDTDELDDAIDGLAKRILHQTPARTLRGVQAKLELAYSIGEGRGVSTVPPASASGPLYDETMTWSVLEDLRRLTGETIPVRDI